MADSRPDYERRLLSASVGGRVMIRSKYQSAKKDG
jgi:hypothetical protein